MRLFQLPYDRTLNGRRHLSVTSQTLLVQVIFAASILLVVLSGAGVVALVLASPVTGLLPMLSTVLLRATGYDNAAMARTEITMLATVETIAVSKKTVVFLVAASPYPLPENW